MDVLIRNITKRSIEKEWFHWQCPDPQCETNTNKNYGYSDVEYVEPGSFVRFECSECKAREICFLGSFSHDGYALMAHYKTGEIPDLRVVIKPEKLMS